MIVLIGCNGALGPHLIAEINHRKKPIICLSRSRPEGEYKNLHFIKCDIHDRDTFYAHLSQIFSEFPVESVIQNAATSFSSPDLNSLSDEQLQRMVNINIIATAKLLQILENKDHYKGQKLKYVYISSNSIKTLNASNPFYIASKVASESLVLNFARRMGKHCVANIVRPGLMRSNLTEARFDKAKGNVVAASPAGRLASPKEVAKVVVNLIVDMPPTMLGQIISVDGGRTI